MDTPTLVVIASFVTVMVVVALLKLSRAPRKRSLEVLVISTSTIWFLMTISGEFIFNWASNETCSKYLGCGAGFLGYDAFEHLFFGIAGALAILWFCERFPKYSILHSEKWKTALAVVATIALIAVFWEILECAHDALRVDILHESLRNLRVHINLLDQPSNLDTMGDLTFSLLGSFIGFFINLISGRENERLKIQNRR